MSMVLAAEQETVPLHFGTMKALFADTLDLLTQLASDEGDTPQNAYERLRTLRASANIQRDCILDVFPSYASI